MLTVSGLTVRYGRAVRALTDVDLTAPQGSVTAVLGANGAGKSTLLRAISGTLGLHRGRVDAGEIRLGHRRIDRLDPADVVAAGVVQVPEGRQVFARMSVEDNLRAGGLAVARQRRTAARDAVYDLFPQLARRSTQRAGLLSGGEQQMLAMGRALMTDPDVLLLDEPSLGLAPKMVARIAELVRAINSDGTTILIVEQNAAMALDLATGVVVLEVGRTALVGTATEVAESPELAGLYLGGHGETAPAGPQPGGAGKPDPGPVGATGAGAPRRSLSRWVG